MVWLALGNDRGDKKAVTLQEMGSEEWSTVVNTRRFWTFRLYNNVTPLPPFPPTDTSNRGGSCTHDFSISKILISGITEHGALIRANCGNYPRANAEIRSSRGNGGKSLNKGGDYS